MTLITPKEHILEARKIAETLHKRNPEQTVEMFEEIKQYLVKLNERQAERIRQL